MILVLQHTHAYSLTHQTHRVFSSHTGPLDNSHQPPTCVWMSLHAMRYKKDCDCMSTRKIHFHSRCTDTLHTTLHYTDLTAPHPTVASQWFCEWGWVGVSEWVSVCMWVSESLCEWLMIDVCEWVSGSEVTKWRVSRDWSSGVHSARGQKGIQPSQTAPRHSPRLASSRDPISYHNLLDKQDITMTWFHWSILRNNCGCQSKEKEWAGGEWVSEWVREWVSEWVSDALKSHFLLEKYA